jgi:hypothetical protein
MMADVIKMKYTVKEILAPFIDFWRKRSKKLR